MNNHTESRAALVLKKPIQIHMIINQPRPCLPQDL